MNAVVAPRRSKAPPRSRVASQHDLAFARDVLAGLTAARKTIPGRWRYDARGLALREAIDHLESHSAARLERCLLASAAPAIAGLAGAGARVLALGDDDAPAARSLRAAIERLGRGEPRRRRNILFVPGAISASMACDAVTSARLLDMARQGRHDIVVFAAGALRDAASLVPADADIARLQTELDRNVLVRIRRELGADLDADGFDRRVRLDPQRRCIETTLVSRGPLRARVLGRPVEFGAGEAVLVERLHQHCLPAFDQLVRDAGWSHAQRWVDGQARFAVHVLERA